ncbi:unnamed protein product [Chironomus riparius]|uniref:Uncharacterized protein n=1 Tax=Chironomus riparius TaxID=315576 RepID=A0A9N9RH64_9DIPT|nr:unnamed protein product [Chironomus riparius]
MHRNSTISSILLIQLLSAIATEAKYLINVNDSVSLTDCNFDDLQNISLLNSNPHEIVIHNCHLSADLPNALFIRFHKLRILEITESHLKNIGDFAFNGLNELRILNLGRNNITFVRTWTHENLESLHTLDLRRNAITEVHKFAFTRYTKLLKLNLVANHISSLPDELFRSIPLLKHLNLGKNNLKSIDSHTFKHLHKLIHLELKHNEIEFIEDESFVGLTHMKVLHLQDNKLTSFEQELISNMPRLHHLNLSHNLLDEIKDETFEKNEELISLDLSYNKFEAFSTLSFKGLEVLEILNASNNVIENIDNAIFTDLANLKYLDLSNNQITHIRSDKIFSTTQMLKTIKLNDNLLQSIDDAVFSELKLQHLDLSCNNLSSDNFLWSETVEIAYLNLTYNAYTSINSSILENIIVTDFYENPFICDWLAEEIFTSKNVHYGLDYVVKSRHDLFDTTGIECHDRYTHIVRRLIVLEGVTGNGNDDDIETSEDDDLSWKHQKTATSSENFNYRSALLWFLVGSVAGFLSFTIFRCISNTSKVKKKSEANLKVNHENYTSTLDESKIM